MGTGWSCPPVSFRSRLKAAIKSVVFPAPASPRRTSLPLGILDSQTSTRSSFDPLKSCLEEAQVVLLLATCFAVISLVAQCALSLRVHTAHELAWVQERFSLRGTAISYLFHSSFQPSRTVWRKRASALASAGALSRRGMEMASMNESAEATTAMTSHLRVAS
jgi:hypothetical protein